jgi:hypothetical protein
MSPFASAIHARFDAVSRAEVARLAKKIAALPPHERTNVETAAVSIVHGIAARLAAVVEQQSDEELQAVLDHLFDLHLDDVADATPPLTAC